MGVSQAINGWFWMVINLLCYLESTTLQWWSTGLNLLLSPYNILSHSQFSTWKIRFGCRLARGRHRSPRHPRRRSFAWPSVWQLTLHSLEFIHREVCISSSVWRFVVWSLESPAEKDNYDWIHPSHPFTKKREYKGTILQYKNIKQGSKIERETKAT